MAMVYTRKAYVFSFRCVKVGWNSQLSITVIKYLRQCTLACGSENSNSVNTVKWLYCFGSLAEQHIIAEEHDRILFMS